MYKKQTCLTPEKTFSMGEDRAEEEIPKCPFRSRAHFRSVESVVAKTFQLKVRLALTSGRCASNDFFYAKKNRTRSVLFNWKKLATMSAGREWTCIRSAWSSRPGKKQAWSFGAANTTTTKCWYWFCKKNNIFSLRWAWFKPFVCLCLETRTWLFAVDRRVAPQNGIKLDVVVAREGWLAEEFWIKKIEETLFDFLKTPLDFGLKLKVEISRAEKGEKIELILVWHFVFSFDF